MVDNAARHRMLYGARVTLIGWRLTRRFGRRGSLAPLLFMGIYGPLRDQLGAAATGLIVFGAGPLSIVADALSWIGVIGIGQAVMRLIAGPPDADPLARG